MGGVDSLYQKRRNGLYKPLDERLSGIWVFWSSVSYNV